jgi:hypothetical protein
VQSNAIKTVFGILGIPEMVTSRVFAVNLKRKEMRHPQLEFQKLFFKHLHLRERTEINFGSLFYVFFFRVLLIKNTIFFIPQITAKKAISDRTTPLKKSAVTHLIAILTEESIVAFLAVDHFIAQLELIPIVGIHHIDAMYIDRAVIHPLTPPAAKIEITVFVLFFIIAVRAVLAISIRKSEPRDKLKKLKKLLEKWAVKIKVSAIIQRVPLIAPPDVWLVNRVRTLGIINGNDFLSTEITLSVKEFSLIAKAETSLPATVRAKGWIWDEVLFPAKHRTDVFSKLPFSVRNHEGRLALGAGFGHEIKYLSYSIKERGSI